MFSGVGGGGRFASLDGQSRTCANGLGFWQCGHSGSCAASPGFSFRRCLNVLYMTGCGRGSVVGGAGGGIGVIPMVLCANSTRLSSSRQSSGAMGAGSGVVCGCVGSAVLSLRLKRKSIVPRFGLGAAVGAGGGCGVKGIPWYLQGNRWLHTSPILLDVTAVTITLQCVSWADGLFLLGPCPSPFSFLSFSISRRDLGM